MSTNTPVPVLPALPTAALAIEADLEKKILEAPDKAFALVNQIKDPISYEAAAEFGKAVKALDDKVHEQLDPVCKERDRLHKEATDFRKKYTGMTEAALKTIAKGLELFDKAEEQKRLALEASTQQVVTNHAEEAVIDEAIQLEKEGKVEEAKQILSQPIYIPTVVVPKTTPKVKGVSSKPVWKWRLKKAGDISQVKADYLMINEKLINADVKNHGKKAESMVGGIEVYDDRSYSFSNKR